MNFTPETKQERVARVTATMKRYNNGGMLKAVLAQGAAAGAHSTTLEASQAEAGGLDGWAILCSDCGHVGSYSIKSMSAQYAREHTNYMLTGKAR